ncbi:hypothetical protein HNQ71_002142 [Mesorhizobium sangaii]|uniref:Uncharacterized protein n=1 Tax=Mesorhizobium sangaii TaxID=505389 RepID=A0A841P2J2_9HYPH|nr:hypothetical protein [Mesorhizobium sangaii]
MKCRQSGDQPSRGERADHTDGDDIVEAATLEAVKRDADSVEGVAQYRQQSLALLAQSEAVRQSAEKPDTKGLFKALELTAAWVTRSSRPAPVKLRCLAEASKARKPFNGRCDRFIIPALIFLMAGAMFTRLRWRRIRSSSAARGDREYGHDKQTQFHQWSRGGFDGPGWRHRESGNKPDKI